MDKKMLITDIARFSVNDGPGSGQTSSSRAVLLSVRGATTRRPLQTDPEIYLEDEALCPVRCLLDACPKDAIMPPIAPELSSSEGSTYHKINRAKCDRCMRCVDACRYEALQVTGKAMSVSEILDEVERDRPFYNNSQEG